MKTLPVRATSALLLMAGAAAASAGDAAKCSAADLRKSILGLNRKTAPYTIAADPSGKADLMAEWKIVDAKWYEIFAKAELQEVFRVFMKMDESQYQLRGQDERSKVEWRAGVPSISVSKEKFKGQESSISFGKAYYTEDVGGEIYKYRFGTGELKNPIKKAAETCGWKYKGVAFGKL